MSFEKFKSESGGNESETLRGERRTIEIGAKSIGELIRELEAKGINISPEVRAMLEKAKETEKKE
ncbi:MAG: hypothetical protein A2934_00840 [Candidatus Sungbacteria bacterium RIFCSPLOWO2_01_FULL_47_10]|uniref:Uncharacterized protein n=1 Tax=Candidatus Sungbacteria bacterium RIFCSPLOWO2_01_FULL_47_10 TaxID=1802276 RepID=A0A1G2L274_9BACT|nr:MAG: hypothetical protein A2934_00840 [Candidatus Sungbacteria bacterium RIFCSPLOWO2_01_FULL_47_10]